MENNGFQFYRVFYFTYTSFVHERQVKYVLLADIKSLLFVRFITGRDKKFFFQNFQQK